MKTIIYFLIALMITGFFFTGYSYETNAKKTIVIQSVEGKLTDDMLNRSIQIISGRLKDLGPEKFEILAIPEKNQIQIVLTDNWDMKAVENLILQKGRLGIYETSDNERLKEPLMTNSDVAVMKCLPDKSSGFYYLDINFRDSSVAKWSDATRRNINREIVIAVDDVVLANPLVREEIHNGSCQITGNFTLSEAAYLAALGNNGELPASFRIVQ